MSGGILLIDAEQPFSDQVASGLRSKGFSVKQLDDGKDGLDYAKDNRPDLIVLCVELPKMSGYSICNKLKKDNDLKGIPLIITSKEATPETFAQHKKLKTRAEDYLIKPFSEVDLVEKISALIAVPAAGGASSNGRSSARDEDFDALEALGNDLDLGGGGAGAGEEANVRLDAGDLLGLDDPVPASDDLNLESDKLLADFDAALSSSDPGAGFDDLDLGGSVKPDADLAGFDDALDALGDAPVSAPPPRPAPPPTPRTEPPRPAITDLPRTATPLGLSSADLQQLTTLRRESSDLKAKVAELEAKLRAADEQLRAKDQQIASSSASGGGQSSAREVLNLKEAVRGKEKEIGQLKDEVFEKEKANVDLQEEIDRVRSEASAKLAEVGAKDVEISSLQARVNALSDERDALEQQVQGRLQEAEAERDTLRGQLDEMQGVLEAAQSAEQRLRGELDDAKRQAQQAQQQLQQEKQNRQQVEGKVKDLESSVREQEQRAMQAYQRLKSEETMREKAKKAVEIAFTLLNGEVDTGGSLDLDQIDAE